MFYGVMGNMPEMVGALAFMAKNLCRIATDEQLSFALGRCTLECHYPVKLPDIIKRIPGLEVPKIEAEMRKAWELVVEFTEKYVHRGSDGDGDYEIHQGARSTPVPKLCDRIQDCVRRTGGWRAYKRMTDEDYPFQQKRFFEEYEAWSAVERITDTSKLLEMPNAAQLVAARAMPAEPVKKPVLVKNTDIVKKQPRMSALPPLTPQEAWQRAKAALETRLGRALTDEQFHEEMAAAKRRVLGGPPNQVAAAD